jgi:hypothetical protein
MSNSEKAIDVSPKVEKVTEDQLKKIQGLVGQINNAQLNIGQLETQKAGLLKQVEDLQINMKDMQNSLEEEYGKVSVNIQDGSISELAPEE